MAQEFNAFSVASKGFSCGHGTTGFFAFAIASKGYICDAEGVEPIHGSDSSKGKWAKEQLDPSMEVMLAREDSEVLSIIIAISKRKRRF